jgi:large subunit ribosomal protein L3
MQKIHVKKVNMTQVWKDDRAIAVTVVRFAGPDAEKALFDTLQEGDRVGVSGISKGKGFQGVVKRHGFHGGPQTHGQKNRLRAPGSIGSTAPQRVIKGRRMAGHMGQDRVTLRNIPIVAVDTEGQRVSVKGAVPGMRGTLVELRIP